MKILVNCKVEGPDIFGLFDDDVTTSQLRDNILF